VRPFRVLGVQQIALGSSDKQRFFPLWIGLLGIPSVGSYRNVAENVDEEILRIGSGASAVEIDLMQPLDPSKKPRPDAPALNHFGLWIDDLKAAYVWLEARGVHFTPGGIRKGAAGHDVCFIHPKPSPTHPVCGEGVLVELVQAPPDLIA
jgi:lactoylglutathione lyase